MSSEEAVTNEVVASAHIENYAVKLFLWADKEDRASNFNKNVVKAFYSAGILFDVLTICTQSELSPENAHMKKYSKWKAAYIHNCLKNGETPVPGPMEGEEDNENEMPPSNTGASAYDEPQIPTVPNTQVNIKALNKISGNLQIKSGGGAAGLILGCTQYR
jgi:vacuolar protein sorting-associated protein VTA1